VVDVRAATTTSPAAMLEEEAVEEFRASLRDKLLTPGEAGYDRFVAGTCCPRNDLWISQAV
jgi:hypothetical protein